MVSFLAERKDRVIPILSKSDLGGDAMHAKLTAVFGSVIELSNVTDGGLDALAAEIERRFLDGGIDLRHDPVVASARQYASLVRCRDALAATLAALSAGFAEELCAADIETAMQAVGELDSRAVSDDIVSNIFSRFCVGK